MLYLDGFEFCRHCNWDTAYLTICLTPFPRYYTFVIEGSLAGYNLVAYSSEIKLHCAVKSTV